MEGRHAHIASPHLTGGLSEIRYAGMIRKKTKDSPPI
jgi:hypothetical protein